MMRPNPPTKKEPLEMSIELTVIEDLGIKLYGTLPPVLSEIVANCWDAESKMVEIRLPDGPINEDSVIEIEDKGCGMTYEDIQEIYLKIGRKRREVEGKETTPVLDRPVMGRKGIGKLSIFGVAKVVEIETIKGHVMNSFRMVLDDILKDAREKKRYRPQIIKCDERVEKEKGTVVRLRYLKRVTPVNVDAVRRKLARHFAIIGPEYNFTVSVNGKEISKVDKYRNENMEFFWEFENEVIDEGHPDWKVSGWIGTTKKPLDEEERSIVVMARGKLLQSPTAFETKVGEKYSYSYIVGEINAEFLDKEEDLISTDRQSLVWESPQGMALKKWGQTKLKKITDEWVDLRRREREKVIREDPTLKAWLGTLQKPERRIADKVIRALTSDESMEDERRKELASFMKESFEQKVFHEMVASLQEGDPQSAKLIEIFEEWDIIEAREILRMVKGRLTAIEQFTKLVESGAREVPTIHNFFRKWPWILEPTWTRWQDEVYYSKLLRDHFPDDKLEESDRRIDFICIGVGDTVHVVELKRPTRTVNLDDLNQLMKYVSFIRSRLGTSKERGYKHASGYIVGEERSNDAAVIETINLYEKDRMYFRRYGDLLVVARQLHSEYEKKLEEFEKEREGKAGD